jgi:1-phosphofructokinase family hexose kinase
MRLVLWRFVRFQGKWQAKEGQEKQSSGLRYTFAMIHTITLNPTLDLTYIVDAFTENDTVRAQTVYRMPGGKGINVSRMATRIGHPTVALGFIAGSTGLEVSRRLEDEGVNTWFTPLETGETRTNPIIEAKSGQHLRVSGLGPFADQRAVQSLREAVFLLRAPDFLLVSGSRLQGVPEDFYTSILHQAKTEGIKTVVDADGAELEHGIAAGAYLIKPNRHELERLLKRHLPTVQDVLSGAKQCLEMGVGLVAASMGGDGALLVSRDFAYHAKPPKVQHGSAVGAGDSFLAGLLAKLAEGQAPKDALRFAIACGSATASVQGSQLGNMELIGGLLSLVDVYEL